MTRDVHAALARALEDLRSAEKNAVLLFAEVMVNGLYRDLGFASMEHYSAEKLGFSKGKTKQFMRLASRLEELPTLRRALDDGEIPWTAARQVQGIATPETEGHWVEQAKRSSRRELTKQIDLARATAKRERKRRRTNQAELVPAAGNEVPGAGRAEGGNGGPFGEPIDGSIAGPIDMPITGPITGSIAGPIDVPRRVTLHFTGEQYDRYLALVEARRKAGCRSSREELVLEALAATPVVGSSRAPHHKIVTRVCPTCRAASTATPGGDRPVPLPDLAARMEDAEIVDEHGNTRRTIPPKTRARVLARDGHRCQAKGCGNTQFLEVHHQTPVSCGGTNDPDNLITLCSGCHRALHERRSQLVAVQQGTRVSGSAAAEGGAVNAAATGAGGDRNG